MNLLHEEVKKALAAVLQQGLQALGAEESLETIYGLLAPSPNIDMGQLAFPMFIFAKSLRSAPPKLAEALVEALPQTDWIVSAVATGPYVNFVLSSQFWADHVLNPILDGSYFSRKLITEAPKTMIEYSQPNTHKELHVGHMRNLALGDALIRMLRYAGYDIVSATFPGDVGTHVAKCLWYMKNVNQEPVPAKDKGAWLGTMYVKGNLTLKEIEGTAAEAEAKAIMTEILKQLEAQSGEYYDLWKETREWSIEQMKFAYKWADVEFDAWYWESDVDAESVAYARELFAEGKLIESKGAIGMDLEDVNLGFALMIKGDGTGLYLTKDVSLAKRKFEENGIENSIYIVDQRQKRHFQQVFEVLKRLGFEQAKNCYHLEYDYVEGKDGMFESRKGNAVPLMDLIRQMEKMVATKYLNSQVAEGKMEAAEAEEVAEIVSKGAIKYGMIRIDPAKKITFDMDEWTNLQGDSGPYQQYTYARIQSLLAKQGYDENAERDFSLLDDAREIELLVKAGQFNDVLLAGAKQYRPNMVSAYLYDLAKLYNNMNNSIIIRDITDEKAKQSKMAIHQMVATIIKEGLAVLGIPVPDRM